jgi:hypothetical protein
MRAPPGAWRQCPRPLDHAVNEPVVALKGNLGAGCDLGRVVANAAVLLKCGRQSEYPETCFGVVVLGRIGAEELFECRFGPAAHTVGRRVEPAGTARCIDPLPAGEADRKRQIDDCDVVPAQLGLGEREETTPFRKGGDAAVRDGGWRRHARAL